MHSEGAIWLLPLCQAWHLSNSAICQNANMSQHSFPIGPPWTRRIEEASETTASVTWPRWRLNHRRRPLEEVKVMPWMVRDPGTAPPVGGTCGSGARGARGAVGGRGGPGNGQDEGMSACSSSRAWPWPVKLRTSHKGTWTGPAGRRPRSHPARDQFAPAQSTIPPHQQCLSGVTDRCSGPQLLEETNQHVILPSRIDQSSGFVSSIEVTVGLVGYRFPLYESTEILPSVPDSCL